jgi:hypothetical protein
VRFAHVLDHEVDRLDDLFFGVRLAALDDEMLAGADVLPVKVMFLGEAVISSAVPGGQEIGVFLVRVGELRAAERLYINVPVRVSVGR